MRGFKKGIKIWVHREDGTRKLINKDEFGQYQSDGYTRGSGIRTKGGRGCKNKKSVYTYEPLDFSLECTPFPVDKQYRKLIKKIHKDDLDLFLFNNPEWRRGRGTHYNVGSRNANFCGGRSTPHSEEIRARMRRGKLGRTRIYNPQSDEKGIFAPKDELEHYLELGWVKGVRLKSPKWTCPCCGLSLSSGRAEKHKSFCSQELSCI